MSVAGDSVVDDDERFSVYYQYMSFFQMIQNADFEILL